MAAPPNQTPATAIVIAALPFSATIAAADLQLAAASAWVPSCSTPAHTVWYAYTVPVGQEVLGVTVRNAPSAQAGISVWVGDPGAPTPVPAACNTTPAAGPGGIELNVTPETTYWIALDAGVDPVADPCTLGVLAGPTAAAAAGDLLVLHDVGGYPAALLRAADGAVLRMAALPSAEMAGILADGTLGVLAEIPGDETHAAAFTLYDPDLRRLVVNTAVIAPGQLATSPVSVGRGDQFWMLCRDALSPGILKTLSSAGVVGATTWTLPSNSSASESLAPSLDGTTVAYSDQHSVLGHPHAIVHVYDLVGRAPLADLVDFGPETSQGRDLLRLSNGDLLALYTQATIPTVAWFRGDVLQATYPLGANVGSVARIAIAVDPSAFVSMHFPAPGVSRFQFIRVADGAVTLTYDVGHWEPLSATPIFAPGQSCPVLVLRQASAAPGPPDPRTPIRRLRRAPHLSAEQIEQFFARFQLDLEAGVGTAVDPGTDPQVWLRWSDDGGHTWRAPIAVSAGTQGAYRRRALWRRLGRSRDRVFEVSMSDPVKWALLAAAIDAGKGSS